MKNSETEIEKDKEKESPCRARFMRKYIFASIVLFLMIAATLAFIFFTQEQKHDPASEKVIRMAAARQLHKDPNELTDKDFAKITEMSIIPTMGSGGIYHWIDVSTERYITTLKTGELADIKLLGKFTNMQTLYLERISFPQQNIPKWMKILAKFGIFDLSEKFSIDLSPLENCTNLNTLLLNGSQIKNIEPLSGLVNLKTLGLSQTGVTKLEPIRRLTNLEDLNLDSTKISDLEPIKRLVNLRFLNFYCTPISDLEPVNGLEHLEFLRFGGAKVTSLEPIRNLKNLYNLDLSSTEVSNLEPIKDLNNMKYLALISTRVSDLDPIRGMTKLEILQIGDTPVSDLEPIKELKLLKYIYVENCMNITQEQVDDLKKALPGLQFTKEAID